MYGRLLNVEKPQLNMKYFHVAYQWGILFTLLALITASCAKPSSSGEPAHDNASIPIITPPSSETVTAESTPISILDEHNTVKLAWFYRPTSDFHIETLVKNFDLFILTHLDEEKRDLLKKAGASSPFLQYLQMITIMDPGSCEAQPWGNQVAYKPNDFCQISLEHPDWFLLDVYGNRIYDNEITVFMDPGNEGYRAFWLERAREMQEIYGWDGIFLDNAEASLNKLRDRGYISARYDTDEKFQESVKNFLIHVNKNYFTPAHRPLLANIVEVNDYNVWLAYQEGLDGVMIERFAVGWADTYLPPFDWEEQMQAVEESQRLNKTLIFVSQGNGNDPDRQLFALASYLLVANSNTTFRYTNYEKYDEIWLYENYNLDLGQPLGTRYQKGINWQRDFTRGRVTVNPYTHAAAIETSQ
jgi:hypothetical protein